MGLEAVLERVGKKQYEVVSMFDLSTVRVRHIWWQHSGRFKYQNSVALQLCSFFLDAADLDGVPCSLFLQR